MEKLWHDFSFGLFFWQATLLLVLLVLLRKYAWKPILESLNNREEGIKDALKSAEEAKIQMQNLQADNRELLKEAREERDAMLKEAREIKEKMISEASEEAQEKANKIVANAKVVIEKEKQDAVADLKNQVADLSVEIAEKVIRKQLSGKEEQMKLVGGMLEDVKLN